MQTFPLLCVSIEFLNRFDELADINSVCIDLIIMMIIVKRLMMTIMNYNANHNDKTIDIIQDSIMMNKYFMN